MRMSSVSPNSDKDSGADLAKSHCIIEDVGDDRQYYRGVQFNRALVNEGRLFPTDDLCCFASWNIEGYSDEKQVILEHIMMTQHIGILCIQETYRQMKEYFVTDAGYLVIMAGDEQNAFAGVEFNIIP